MENKIECEIVEYKNSYIMYIKGIVRFEFDKIKIKKHAFNFMENNKTIALIKLDNIKRMNIIYKRTKFNKLKRY